MKIQKWIWIVGLVCLVAAVVVWRWRQDAPRRACLETATQLCTALNSGDTTLLQTVALPDTLATRTAAEQSEFLRKALADEISPEGLILLKRKGLFGTLTNVFPDEAAAWSRAAGVNVGDCVAFKLERNGVRAEMVFVREEKFNGTETAFRIVRCNNVKQLAPKEPQP